MAKTTNSSPPIRATTSVSRKPAFSTCAAAVITRSPASWPKVSLVRFKPSRSMKNSRLARLLRRAALRPCSARRKKLLRLCSPVNSSVNESLRISSSARLRSAISVTRLALTASSSWVRSITRCSSKAFSACNSVCACSRDRSTRCSRVEIRTITCVKPTMLKVASNARVKRLS
ncbi:hypothetical protein D9M70_500850 [compost metagenome]